MNANDMLPGQPEGQEPLEQLFRDVCELADETARRITDAEVNARLQQLLDKTGYSSETAPEPDPASLLYAARHEAAAILAAAQLAAREMTAKTARTAAEAEATRRQAEGAMAEAEQFFDAALDRAASMVAAARHEAESIIAGAEEDARRIVAAASVRAGRMAIQARQADPCDAGIHDQGRTEPARELLPRLILCEGESDRRCLACLHQQAFDERSRAAHGSTADAPIGSGFHRVLERISQLVLDENVRHQKVDVLAEVNGHTWFVQAKYRCPVPAAPDVPAPLTPLRRNLWPKLRPGLPRGKDYSPVLLSPHHCHLGYDTDIWVASRFVVAVRSPIEVKVIPAMPDSGLLNEWTLLGDLWSAASPGTTGETTPEDSEPAEDTGDAAPGSACFASALE